MSCASCGRANRAGARFCAGCGASLAPRCPACGVEARPDARFCDACGAGLAAAPAPAEASVARKVVTIVFADLIGSTALQEKLDPERVSRVMEAYHAAVRVPVEAHGGTLVQLLGDGVMCAFGVPQVAEDDALRAVRAAVAVQESFRAFLAEHPELAGKVGLRVAVNTGEVVVSDDYAAGIGDPLNVAARLQQEARDGDVLIGESTQRHVRERVTLVQVGSFALKGRAEPVAAYRVVSLERPPGAAALPFVGREDELRRLQAVYDSAVSTPAARLAVLLGSPGLGKSRLVAELAQRLEGRVALLSARCESARGATFAPLAAALRAHLGERGEPSAQVEVLLPADEPERARIVSGVAALLAGEPASPQETFFVVRRFLAALAKARPVLLLIDDLHWAEPLLLDLVEHLVQWGSGVRLLVLAAARPELRALRSSLATPGPLASDVVTLAGLDAVAATQLAARVIGAEAFPAAIAGRVLAASEGNPLFLAELVRMLVDDGVLRRQGEAWVAADAIADFAMPPSIHALLAARIERLAPEERTVLERAAVVGRHFSRSALAALLPPELSDLDARLEALRRSELIEPDTGWLLGEPALRFHHALIRDAAYRRVLKNTRAELHGRIAAWMEERAGAAVEYDETIGWHFEQAHQNLRELGPLDERARELGARAARYLGAAGQRALARDDLPLAAGLLGRALERLEPESPARTELLLDRCEALLATGEVGAATPAVAELERLAAGSERLRAWHTCFAGQLAALTDPEALRATAEAAAAAAETLAAAGDTVGEAKAHSVHAGALARLGAIGSCEAALDRALAAARRAGDRRRSNAVLAGAPLAALFGPSPVTRASGRCLDVVRVLRITQGAPAVEAVALRCQAVLEALRGRLDAARRMIAAARRLVEELGITQQLLESDVFAGQIEWLAGDAVAAERWLRDAYTGLRQRGLRIDAARAAAQLGRILLAQGRAREAEELSHESEALAGDDLQAAIAWRGVRAEALAQRGEHGAAIDLARSAVEIASATDALLHHADARRALAAVLAAAGRSSEAAQEDARAVELWETKGATLLAERARGGTQRVAPETRPVPGPSPAPQRRVRENTATRSVDRILAAARRRDLEAIAALIADDFELLHHPTGGTIDREAGLARWRLLLEAEGLAIANESIATLGESLALGRDLTLFDHLAQDGLDVGASRSSSLNLGEVNERGQLVWMEVFAEDRLAEAVARLYARHAELAPEAERCRAVAISRAVALMLGPFDARAIGAILAPGAEYRDERTLGSPGFQGADAIAGWLGTLSESALDVVIRLEEVLATSANVALARWVNTGREPVGGGAFERRMLTLFEFDAEGRISRWEQFDPERVAEALARFDELAGERPAPPRRRVRPNTATAQAARMDAAVGARDLDALGAELAELVEVVEHPLGAVFDASGMLAAWRELLRAEAPVMRSEPLATLGDSLALCRSSMSFAALAPRLENVLGSFGAVEREVLVLFEMGPRGLQRRTELFAPDHLGDAVVRLYARYADLLPDGPARARAQKTARAIAAWLERESHVDRFDGHVSESLRFTDRRRGGFGSMHGADAFLQGHRALFELARDVSLVVEGVLGLSPDAFLLRTKTSGTDRRTGGEFERPLLLLGSFGADGLIARSEWFDPERPDVALARFDELAAPEQPAVRRRLRPNAATANLARIEASVAAREVDGLAELHEPDFESLHHPTEATFDREATVGTLRWIVRSGASFRLDPLATLGDALALFHQRVSSPASGNPRFEVGAYELEFFGIHEAEKAGRARRTEAFASDRLGDAVAGLYARHAELLPEGPERERAEATARAVAALLGPFDLARYRTAIQPNVEFVDHRSVPFPSGRGADELLRGVGSFLETADDATTRVDDVLALRSDALLLRWTTSGRERIGGGLSQWQFLRLLVFGPDGLLTRAEQFDVGHEAEALARFDALTADAARPAPRRRVRPNAATANVVRIEAAVASREVDAFAALFEPGFEALHHPTETCFDREAWVATLRWLARSGGSFRLEPLATLGDALALFHQRVSSPGSRDSHLEVGTWEMDFFVIHEAGEAARARRAEAFAIARLGSAITRLYELYAEGLPAGPERTRAAATAHAAAAWLGPFDPERYATAYAADLEAVDHRVLGSWSARGAAAVLRNFRSLHEVARDIVFTDELLALGPQATLVRRTHRGSELASGRAYERDFLMLHVYGPDGLVTRIEWFDVTAEALAFARFDAAAAEPPEVRWENAVTRTEEEFSRLWHAGDWAPWAALTPPGFESIDRRPLMHLEVDGETMLRGVRPFFEMGAERTSELLATRGERLALFRMRLRTSDPAEGDSEVEFIQVIEVDERGQRIAAVAFGSDDFDSAYAELDARYVAGEGAAHAPLLSGLQALGRALAAADREALARILPDDFTVTSHRRFANVGRALSRDEYVASFGLNDALGVRADLHVHHLRVSVAALIGDVTWHGTRDGGEFEVSLVFVATHDGERLRSWELFDPEQTDAALARYAQLSAKAGPPRFTNRAFRALERLGLCWRTRNWEAVVAAYAPGFVLDDRRALVGLPVAGEDFLANVRFMYAMQSSRFEFELLATRGEHLVLCRTRFAGEVEGGGAFEWPMLTVVETDDRGCLTRHVVFDRDAVDAAVAEFDARYTSGGGADDAAWRDLVAWMEAFERRDFEGLARRLSPDFTLHDHRALGWGTVDAARYVDLLRSITELAPDARYRLDHYVPGGRGCLTVGRVLGTREGGPFEMARITVVELDAAGRRRRTDQYDDAGQLDAARARFAELSAKAGPPRFENAATRAANRLHEASRARDIERFAAELAPAYRHVDRRPLVGGDGDRSWYVESLRPILAMASALDVTAEVLATRGERLSLQRTLITLRQAESGPSEVEFLQIFEADALGRIAAGLVFDLDALDAAWGELDARYAAAEGAGNAAWQDVVAFTAAFNSRDFAGLARRLGPGFALHDHRALGWGTADCTRYVELLRSLTELAPDSRYRLDHFVAGGRGCLTVGSVLGTRDGGAFEMTRITVVELDAEGRRRRMDQYDDASQLDLARARFAELREPAAAEPLANRAFRALEHLGLCWHARHWEAVVAAYAPGFVLDDRRALVGLPVAGEDFLANVRFMYAIRSSRFEFALLATRGERLVLCRTRFAGEVEEGGGFEWPMLTVVEVDDSGCLTRHVVFDPAALDAAFAELDARYFAGEAAAHPRVAATMRRFITAFASRDWDALGALFAEGVEVRDQRRLGFEPLSGLRTYVDSLRALVELAPDVALRIDHARISSRGVLWVASWVGTHEGGAFENPWIIVSEHDAAGVVQRFDQYDVDRLDAALARFAQLGTDPLAIPPNAATRFSARLSAALERDEPSALGALIAPEFRYDDRRRGMRLEGDRETSLASARFAAGWHTIRTPLATAGERLALERALWRNERREAEVEMLEVLELDDEGRLLAWVTFDLDDRRAASLELFERWARSKGGGRLLEEALESRRAIFDHDLARLRELLPAEYEFHDHRRTGPGLIQGAEGYIAWLASLFEGSADAIIEPLYFIADEPHGSLRVGHTFGTLVDGGAFESVFVMLVRTRGDETTGAELFELEDLERARARFEELRPDPLAIPRNAARRAGERIGEIRASGDWAALRALVTPDFRFEDRRKHVQLSGDVELYVRNLEVVASYPELKVRFEPLATAGERVSLTRLSYAGDPRGAAFEGDFLLLIEVDPEGRPRASLHFDADDRAAAFEELQRRFVAGEAGATGGQAPIAALIQAFNGRDWAALRAVLAEDAAVLDRRTLGLGELGAEAWIDSLRALAELAGDVRMEPFRILAWNAHGRVSIARTHGTREGGTFENLLVTLALTRGDRIERFELFDPADAERALARFEELGATLP